MPVKKLFTDLQRSRAHVVYMIEKRSPAEVASILNAEFEHEKLKVTARQITTYASENGWSKIRKEMKDSPTQQASHLIDSTSATIVAQKKQHLEKHQDFLDTSARLGGKIMKKAETLVDNASNARDLASAAGAAAKGIEIYRKAVGLEDVGGGNGGTIIHNYFNFARGEGSPFVKPVTPSNTAEPVTVDVAVEEIAGDGSDDKPTAAAHETVPALSQS